MPGWFHGFRAVLASLGSVATAAAGIGGLLVALGVFDSETPNVIPISQTATAAASISETQIADVQSIATTIAAGSNQATVVALETASAQLALTATAQAEVRNRAIAVAATATADARAIADAANESTVVALRTASAILALTATAQAEQQIRTLAVAKTATAQVAATEEAANEATAIALRTAAAVLARSATAQAVKQATATAATATAQARAASTAATATAQARATSTAATATAAAPTPWARATVVAEALPTPGRGEREITFQFLPGGTAVLKDTILAGNEYLKEGVLLSPNPVSSYCEDADAVKIDAPPYSTVFVLQANYLTTGYSDGSVGCSGVPIRIRFRDPVRWVALDFVGAKVTYEMSGWDQSGGKTFESTAEGLLRDAPFSTITGGTGNPETVRVVFGLQAAGTKILRIRFVE